MTELAHDPKEFSGSFTRSELESKVIAANIDFYRQVTHKFDHSESYLFDPIMQQELIGDLDEIGSHLALLGRRPSCLDCGGGTGNIALKMCARGWTVTVVDVSDKMLSLLEEKARAQGHFPTLIHSPVERFLAATDQTYDLVSFSAVLHHLYSYESVVRGAASLVREGGFFYSNQDPVTPQRPLLARALDSLDIAIAKAKFDRADFFPGVGRRLRKLFSPKDSAFDRAIISAGDLAEYHAHTGVDDVKIKRLLQSNGFEIIEHSRRPGGRTRTVQFLNEQFRVQESFKVIGRRDSGCLETASAGRRAGRPLIDESPGARAGA
jgi:ubiquinone/menaquinone biosynthesis C-methylase UbiE